MPTPLERLRYHVSGAIARGEGTPIVENRGVILICEDLHNERPGYFRAFRASHIDSDTMCPLIGYCSPCGSYRTIRETVAHARRYDSVTPIYRAPRSYFGKARLLDFGVKG